MDFGILRILSFVYLFLFTTSHATNIKPIRISEEGDIYFRESPIKGAKESASVRYWKEQLGENILMPKAIKDALLIEFFDDARSNVGPKNGVSSTSRKLKSVPKVDVNPFTGVHVDAGSKKKHAYVDVKPGLNPFQYVYGPKKDQAQDSNARALFFLQDNMKPGRRMTMQFTQSTTNAATFLPRKDAESLPFSTNSMSKILREFSVQPGSVQAQILEQTIRDCERKGIEGEKKYCATSLESMIDFIISSLGKKVMAMSTEVKELNNKLQMYTINGVMKLAEDDNAAVCHKQKYAYAVFYCHKSKATSAYRVTLYGEDGSKAKAVAICHKDTSAWNPNHLAFQVLNVKPGTVPVCHFLPEDHIAWVNLIFWRYKNRLLLVTRCHAKSFHPKQGAIAKNHHEGGIHVHGIATTSANVNASLEYWKQHLGQNTQIPKAIRESLGGNFNFHAGVHMNVSSMIRFEIYIGAKSVASFSFNMNQQFEFGANSKGSHKGIGLDGKFKYSASGGASGQLANTKPDDTKVEASPPLVASAPSGAGSSSGTVASIQDSIASLFFLETDMSLGKKMNLHYTESTNKATFLPRDMVDKLPFSLAKFPDILRQFKLEQNSLQATIMKVTLTYCEDEVGGDKCCNSLESMVDFATTIIGKQVKAISANVDKERNMEFKIQEIKKLPSGREVVTCNKIPFPCAVFYCQKVDNMAVFMVTLVGSDGSKIKMPAICHEDTNSWDPNHWVFKTVKAKPGSCPLCHFVLDDDVLWVTK